MKITKLRPFAFQAITLAGIACAAIAFGAQQANAITLTVSSGFLGGNSADNNDTSNPRAQNLSLVNTVNPGGFTPDLLAATVAGEARYRSITSADAEAASGGSITRNASHNYRVTLTVTPDDAINTIYDLTLDTRLLGALVIRNEGGANGRADISAIAGLINGVGDAGVSLADIAGIDSNSTTVTQINQSNSITLSGLSGVQVFNVDFLWSTSTFSGNNLLTGGDEGVVILGMQGTISQVGAADDYPGTSGRTNGLAEDGHWLAATVTVVQIVPEPSSIALGLLGAGALGMVAFRRRKA